MALTKTDMIVDNFEAFEKCIMNFQTDDSGDPYIYQIDLIERKKDGVDCIGSKNSSRRVASFYPEDIEQWQKYKNRIKEMCTSRPGLRAYINPSRKKASKVLLHLNTLIAKRLYDKAYTGLSKLYPSAIASCKPYKQDALWVLDVDVDDPFSSDDILEYFESEGLSSVIVTSLPSKSGCHIITKAFDRRKFDEWLNNKWGGKKTGESIVHINSLTNLYINTGI